MKHAPPPDNLPVGDIVKTPSSKRPPVRRVSQTLEELHNQYLLELRYVRRLRPTTLESYRLSFELFVSLVGASSCTELTPTVVATFFERLESRVRILNNGTRRTGVKASTIYTHRMKLSGFFSWLTSRGHLDINPLSGMRMRAPVYTDKKYLGKNEVERLFAALILSIQWKSQFLAARNLAIFSVLLNCGVRKGELLALKVFDVNIGERTLTVHGTTSKSRNTRQIPLNSSVVSHLAAYVQQRRHRRLTTLGFFASANSDAPLTNSGLDHLVLRVVAASGVKFHPHQLRHTFAVNLLHSGCDIEKVRQLLGHRDIRMTSLYLRALPTMAMQQDVERLVIDNLL